MDIYLLQRCLALLALGETTTLYKQALPGTGVEARESRSGELLTGPFLVDNGLEAGRPPNIPARCFNNNNNNRNNNNRNNDDDENDYALQLIMS